MIETKISPNIRKTLNNSRLGLIYSNVKIVPSTAEYLLFIEKKHRLIVEALGSKRETEYEVIKETRSAYKLCGKEPSRYRPSAEALLRRLRIKKSLYQINNVVDTINMISVCTHYSIGGFDHATIENKVLCDVGNSDPYEAIGRGNLNIEFMPGLKDDIGFFGTPTSDSVRTMVTENTEELLLVFYDFYGNDTLEEAMDYGEEMLKKYCYGTHIFKKVVK